MHLVRVILISLVLVGVTLPSHADEINIPFSVKIESFKRELLNQGLDLYGQDDSDGYVFDRGSEIVVYTYKPLKITDMYLIKDVAMENLRG
jgi:hypothetical protein